MSEPERPGPSSTVAVHGASKESSTMEAPKAVPDERKRDLRFWLIFVSLSCTTLLSALDLGGIGTAAPTIVHDLSGKDFSWVSAAYTLASSSFIPLSGNMAQVFGRRPILLGAIIVFAVGSAVSGSARNMDSLIVGRAVQGVGYGGLQALVSIVISDLVPLRDRGVFQGITGMVWTLGSVAGPFIAGSLSEKASWRWLFYINLPLCALAFAVAFFFLQLKSPHGAVLEKLAKIDWLGNLLIIASTCSTLLALTWGGVQFQWNSVQVLIPLIIGLVGLAASLFYEFNWPANPTIPRVVLSNLTSFSGYVATFIHGIIIVVAAFYLPTWFQAIRMASPIVSAIYFLPITATISPTAIIQGLIVAKTGKYRYLVLVAWCILTLGVGLLIALELNSPLVGLILIQLLIGVGIGLVYATTFAVLSPLPVEQNAAAVSLIAFLRVFSQAWGVSIGGTILQNILKKKLPASILNGQSLNSDLAYAIIPLIPSLPEPEQIEVRQAFWEAFRSMWIVMTVLCAVAIISFFMMKDIPLRRTVDKNWGVKENKKIQDSEKTAVTTPSQTSQTQTAVEGDREIAEGEK